MKTYRAIRHDIVRTKQTNNSNEVHHPDEKKHQILNVLNGKRNLNILELFSGQGNLTKIYSRFGNVETYDQKTSGDSFLIFHKLIYEKRKYDVIDLDPYGFPNRFFPDIFLLIDNGILFVTMPKPYVNILNGITRTHLISYFDEHNPNKSKIINKICLFGLCHWRKIILIHEINLKRLYRFAFQVQKVKATEYCKVKNH